ncbi:MAG: NAD/NADP octopine/nopaline dehydrogenase family protein [Pseudomonadota bacterium]
MSEPRTVTRVGIAGAGSIAFAVAAVLEDVGHTAVLWSPSGAGTKGLEAAGALTATGAVEGTFHPKIAATPAELAEADVLIVAVPAYGHKAVMDALAPHVRDGQPVIISSHASFGALYMARLLAARGARAPIIAWGTTVATARRQGEAAVLVNTVRSRVDLSTVPLSATAEGMAVCERLFGERFVDRGSLMAIALSNLNPQNHLGIALGNMTRMEHGETWSQGANVTPNVGRLLEALDAERLAIAGALGLEVRNIFQHFHLSFHVPEASISEMNQQMHREGRGGTGPATADSRYVTEDVPYGLLATAKLGRMTGQPALLHEAGIAIFSAMYGRDFAAENNLFDALDMDHMTIERLEALANEGAPLANAAR